MSFYDRLKKFLAEKKMTNKEFLEKLNISSSNFTFWKQGALPRSDLAIRIAKMFGTTVEYLIIGDTGDGFSSDDYEIIYKLRSLKPESRNAVLTLLDGLYNQELSQNKSQYS